MRILVVTPYFYPHLGGSERYIEQLYSSLIKLDKSIQVDVLTYNTNRSKKHEIYRGMNIYRVGCLELLSGQFAIPNYVELIGLLRRLKHAGTYHLVNAHTRFFESAWWGWLVARYFGAISILTDHCANHPTHPNLIIRQLAKFVDRIVIPFVGRNYDHITVVSQATRAFLKQHGVLSAMTVIPNSVDVDVVPKQMAPSALTVCFVGRPIPAKGINLFLAVSKRLGKEFPTCRFVQVTHKTHQQVMNILAHSDILLHPSIHHEGLPTVILEAGMTRCAVVATDNGGTREVIIDGKTGLLVPPEVDAMVVATRRLILDATLRLKLGNGLHKKVMTEYTWKQTAVKFLNTLHRGSRDSSK